MLSRLAEPISLLGIVVRFAADVEFLAAEPIDDG